MVNLTEHYPRMGAPDKVPSITHRTAQQQTSSGDIRGQHSVIVMDPRAHDRETLRTIISQWNANRLKIFELSDPDENMEFYGVMRFYFQEAGDKVATKCVRVTSTQMAKEVVETLVEKFRPDMKMLTLPHFGLYETYANGEERRLKDEEKPLLVQLNWHKDDRDGRFLLKNEDEPRRSNSTEEKESKNFDRRMSKREKKEAKKQKEKEDKLKSANESLGISQEQSDAEKLFKQLPETSFHRSISNPEAVMRRRRQQKLEKKLQQFKSKDGGPDTGGTLKIFGESINRDVPYKTLLLSIHDTVETVIKQTLDKYGLEREEVAKYCLMQAVLPAGTSADNVDPHLIQETVLASSDCPLQILMHFPSDRGTLIFNLKKKSEIGMKKENPANDNGISRPLLVQNPYLIESLPNGLGQAFQLFPGITEVGNNQMRLGAANFFNVNGPDVLPSHCAFNRLEHTVTVTPFRDATGTALVLVDAQKIDSTVALNDGASIRIGQSHRFRLCIPQTFGPPLTNGHHDRIPLPLTTGGTLQRRPTDFPVGNRTQYLCHQDSVDDNARSETTSLMGSFRSSPNLLAASRLQILPATLEFREERENDFLRGVIIDPNPVGVKFKLAPTYVLYMAARYRGSTNFRPEIVPLERAHLLSKFLKKVASLFLGIVRDNQGNAEYLAFWLANASELLHLLKQDRHMSIYATDAHDILTQSICQAFHHLTVCQQILLERALPGLFAPTGQPEESEGNSEENVGWGAILAILTRTLNLVKRCRLNAALTIQLSSQLFHYISMWLFNSLVHNPERCNRHFGEWLQSGLELLMRWADKHGLEVAAEYYLAKIIQVATLLVMPKTEMNATIYASVGHRLNSEQIRFVLENYNADAEADPEDYPFSSELLEAVTAIAQGLADEAARENGEPIQLEEPLQMNLSLTIPEEGYSVTLVKGMHNGLEEFLEPLRRAGICDMTIHPHSQGSWAVYLTQLSGQRSPSTSFDGGRAMQQPVAPHPTQYSPSVMQVSFPKGSSGIGLSIVATRIPAQDKLGIFVKSVVKGGAADADGRVQSGDQLLKVNGRSLVNVNQERAAELIGESGKTVHLEVLKQGAFINGLATIINDSQIPSPAPVRATANYQEQNGPRVAVPVNGHGQPMSAYPSQLPTGHDMPPPEHFHPHQQQQQQHQQWVPQEIKPMPPPPLPTMDIQRRRMSPQTIHLAAPTLQQRLPSPIRETIATQMHAQRDKMRQEAKMMEMEDELRRRRQHMQNGQQSPHIPTRGIVHARHALNSERRSVSQERLDAKGHRPLEKRVQWAVDNAKKSPSPTAMQQNPIPDKAVRFVEPGALTNGNGQRQETLQAQLSNGLGEGRKAEDNQGWTRGQTSAPLSRDTCSSPSSSPWLRAEQEQMQLWRQSEARRFRDEEIDNLQSRQGQLTAVEAERLRTLLLERDFQHRAEQGQEDGSEEEGEDDDDEDEEEESQQISYHQEKEVNRKANLVVLPKVSPHLHHPVAVAQPEVYKTSQQENFDRFVRHHQEYNAVNEAIKRSREHLDNNPDSPLTVRHSPASPPQPNGYLSSVHQAATYGKRMTAGAEIRHQVETARLNGHVNGTASVVGIHEVYNDPRSKILNAKVLRLPQQDNDTSPEKLSFRDKMKMFAISMGEDPKDRLLTNSSKQREIDYGSS